MEHTQNSSDLLTFDLIQQVVELGHSLLPMVELCPGTNVISFSAHLLTLRQHLQKDNKLSLCAYGLSSLYVLDDFIDTYLLYLFNPDLHTVLYGL